MHRLLLTVTAAATVLATGALVPNRVEALPLSASMGANVAIETLAQIDKVGVCFYVDGWNGPGLYECGFHRRQGQGWHGARDGGDRRGRDLDRNRRGDQTEGRGLGLHIEGRGLQTEGRGYR
jgi:hypothetical protein